MLGFSYMTYHTTEAPQVKLQIALNRGFDFRLTGSNYLSNLCVCVCCGKGGNNTGVSLLCSECAYAIYNHVTMGKFLAVHTARIDYTENVC